MIKDNEDIYDEQISQLMEQIIAICKKHKIPMLASFQYHPDGLCTTCLPRKGQAPQLTAAAQIVQQGFAAFAVTTSKDDGE
jgi:hypothetical protein